MGVSVTQAAERVALVKDFERDTARRAATALASEALRTRDTSTAEHCDDVVTLCDAVGHRLGLDELLRRQLASGAQLHDVGKVGIPLSIVNKSTALSEAEWTVMREHTVIGERILRAVPAMSDIATIVRHSHEHWDGSGYPDGLGGDAIPLPSRVILCADAFHAMRSDRPYRRGRDADAALAEIEACAGTQFDPMVADAFLAVAGDARNGIPMRSDRIRKRRLVALLTALAIGTGSALAAIPAVRDAVKSIFATSVPPTQAASTPHASPGTLGSHGLWLGPVGEALRLPPAQKHEVDTHESASDAHTRGSAAVAQGAERRRQHSRGGPKADGTPAPVREPITRTEPSPSGRALGRDVPAPRATVHASEGGRTDPPALGLRAGPSGRANRHSR